jgi:hypothetical protein
MTWRPAASRPKRPDSYRPSDGSGDAAGWQRPGMGPRKTVPQGRFFDGGAFAYSDRRIDRSVRAGRDVREAESNRRH